MTKILDKGEVTLLNQMGGDLAVIAAARVSNGASYEEASKGPESDQRLINYLIKHRHGTPFEHSTFQFYIKAPLFVVREWQRHRMASYNEISGRYVEFEPEFYYPVGWRVQAASNKQGSVFPEEPKYSWNILNDLKYDNVIKFQYKVYTEFLKAGVAKEMARMVLPLSLYSQFYMTVNARSLMNFLSLRAADDAQWEIRQYAIAMKEMFKEKMPMTYKAWENNRYITP
jgi:thymidylate synthase (FAD)